LSKLQSEITGGRELAFEAYFCWAPKIVPKENNGVMIRVADASGTLFDASFLQYEVAEQTRLRQITGEIFVHKGLEGALNIDRESFNYSHPHYQFLAGWVHRALRQIANKHKELGKGASQHRKKKEVAASLKVVDNEVELAFEELGDAAPDAPASVDFTDDDDAREVSQARKKGRFVFSKPAVFGDKVPRGVDAVIEGKAKAIIQLLDGYGLLARMSYKRQQSLLRSICAIMLVDGE
jgi:hypothetical protein